MIDTSDDIDTESRVVTFLFRKDKKFLIGVSPQHYKKKDLPNQWDVAGKGHISVGDGILETVVKEVYEETSIRLNPNDPCLVERITYQHKPMFVFVAYSANQYGMFDDEIKCQSYFEMYGKQWPELKELKWVSIEEAKTCLYKGLVTTFEKYGIFDQLEEFIESK